MPLKTRMVLFFTENFVKIPFYRITEDVTVGVDRWNTPTDRIKVPLTIKKDTLLCVREIHSEIAAVDISIGTPYNIDVTLRPSDWRHIKKYTRSVA